MIESTIHHVYTSKIQGTHGAQGYDEIVRLLLVLEQAWPQTQGTGARSRILFASAGHRRASSNATSHPSAPRRGRTGSLPPEDDGIIVAVIPDAMVSGGTRVWITDKVPIQRRDTFGSDPSGVGDAVNNGSYSVLHVAEAREVEVGCGSCGSERTGGGSISRKGHVLLCLEAES